MAITLRKLKIFLIFPNFLRSKLLSGLKFLEVICRYNGITNNDVSCHLWWKENLLSLQKVSKYYEHDCRYYEQECLRGVFMCGIF